jgi:hypothetical protein
LSALVQEFYLQLQRRLETKEVYHALTEEDVKKIMDFSEKFVMMCCYKLLFCPQSTNDEEKDLELQNRIRFDFVDFSLKLFFDQWTPLPRVIRKRHE